MNNLERYLDQVIEQKTAVVESPPERKEMAPTDHAPNVFAGILRRWHIAVLVFIAICAAGLPAMWLLLEPRYVVVGSIRVAPILPSILTGGDTTIRLSNYANYLNTQAVMLTSNRVLQRVADGFVGRDMGFFKGGSPSLLRRIRRKLGFSPQTSDSIGLLTDAIAAGQIAAAPVRGTELITVTMRNRNQTEARQIVDALIRNYMDVYVSGSAQEDDDKLRLLEAERTNSANNLKNYREEIRKIASEYGETTLEERQRMILQRITALLAETTKWEATRIGLELNLSVLDQAAPPNVPLEQLASARDAYVNSDPMFHELTRTIIQLERDIIVAKQTLTDANPGINSRQDLLDQFKAELEKRRQELFKTYDENLALRVAAVSQERLQVVRAQIDQIKAQEDRLHEVINQQDSESRRLGRTHLLIQDLQSQHDVEKGVYDTFSRRILEVEMERKRPARITVANPADTVSIEDRRVKYSAALLFGAFGCGCLLAFLRDKSDQTLHTPDDVTRRADLPLIGTTTSSRGVKSALFAEQISGDYQVIRANLGLLTSEGMPRKLAVTSPGTREGKTTFAVNLATSIAKSGKKVLLIDGHIRKPDVARMLGITNGSDGLADVLSGGDPARAIRSVASSGLDVLPSNPHRFVDVYELLSAPTAAAHLAKLAHRYDHVIVDTPPALAFPDALIWAKWVDGVILVTFAGQTSADDLKEARDRLTKARARILGAVMSNVPVEHSYYRYDYDYYSRSSRTEAKPSRSAKKLLLPLGSEKEDTGNGAKS